MDLGNRYKLFDALYQNIDQLSILAEDSGELRNEVMS